MTNLSVRQEFKNAGCRASFALAWCLVLISCLPLRAGDVLDHVPHDAAGIITFRDIRSFDKRLSEIVRVIKPEMQGLPLADLEATLGFAPGTIDLERRITAIFLHPDELTEFVNSEGIGNGEAPYPVVAFEPVRAEEFEGGSDASSRIYARQGLWGNYYYFMDGGTVFVANRRKSLRILSRLPERNSLESRLDDATRKIYEISDAFGHFSLDAWHDRLNPFVAMIGNMVQMGIMAQQSPDSVGETDAMLKWIIDGAKDAFDQMNSVTLAVQIDGPQVRVHHLLRFDRNRWMSGYLKSVSKSGDEPFQVLPDQPFLGIGYTDWICPVDQSLSKQMTERMCSLSSMKKRFSKARQTQLTEATLKCASNLRLSDFLFSNPTGDLMPFEVFGSYTTDHPEIMLDVLESLHEDSGEAWSVLMSGGLGLNGKFTHQSQNGQNYREMRLDQPGMAENLVQEVKQAYGEKVSFQLATIGKRHITYSIAQPPAGVLSLAKSVKEGRTIGNNPSVRMMRDAMPKDANILFVADVGRLVQGAQSFGGWPNLGGRTTNGTEARLAGGHSEQDSPNPKTTGPLLGWTCRVSEGSLDCQLAVNGIDLAALFSSLVKSTPKANKR